METWTREILDVYKVFKQLKDFYSLNKGIRETCKNRALPMGLPVFLPTPGRDTPQRLQRSRASRL